MADQDYTTVPPGEYHVRVDQVNPGQTREGSPRFGIALRVVSGPHAGRLAAWDTIVLSERGMHRARRLCEVLGYTIPADLSAFDHFALHGLEAMVQIRPQSYQTQSGDKVTRNEVPYGGWRRFVP